MEAKRGDLVVLEIRHRDFYAGSGIKESYEYSVAVVTSITRDGMVKAARRAGWDGGCPLDRMTGLVRWWVAPKASMDVEAAMAAAAEHTYPNSSTTRGFETLEEARELLAGFRYSEVES